MKIAIFHNLLSGGAKRTLMEAASRLASRHHVDAYALTCSEHDFADIRPFVSHHRVYPFAPARFLESPFGRLNQLLRTADLIRLHRLSRTIAQDIDRRGYDVVFAHPCRFEQSPGILRYLARTPSVYYCQEPRRVLYETMPARPYDDNAVGRRRILNRLDPLPALYHRTLGRAERANARAAGVVLVNSRFMADVVGGIYGVDAQVSYHGVDVDRFRPTDRPRRDFVLSVGSLTPLKGFDFLIRAMAAYPSTPRPALVIASNFQNPPERDYLQQVARDLGVELTLLGNVGDGQLVELYNEARVVAYAPVREPFGLVPLEAMACAAPVVAVSEGGVQESVVDRHTGRLVPRDPVLFAEAIAELVDDRSLARRYGLNGRDHVVSRWSWDRAVAALESHLEAGARARPGLAAVPVLAQ